MISLCNFFMGLKKKKKYLFINKKQIGSNSLLYLDKTSLMSIKPIKTINFKLQIKLGYKCVKIW
jgi:hypothetical protein